MNKKFLSAILFGALMVTSTGTFVSCKDYDDDIENLNGQLNSQKADLEKQIADLEKQLTDANAETKAQLEQLKKELLDANKEAMDKIQAALDELKRNLTSLVFVPQYYYGGIEAMIVNVYNYQAWTTEAVSADEDNSKDAPKAGAQVEMAPQLEAQYHVNPSTVTSEDVVAVKFLAEDKEYEEYKSRAIEDVISFGETKFNITGGKLNVSAPVKDGSIKMESDSITVLAAQAILNKEGKEVTVTSDYAVVRSKVSTGFDLAIATLEAEEVTHLYKTAAEAIADENEIRLQLVWNAEGFDIADTIRTHINDCEENLDSKASDGSAVSKGFEYSYELVGWFSGVNKTSESAHAALNGSVIRPQMTADGKQQAYGAEQSKATIGRLPVVRVTLTDKISGNIAAVGYLPFEIVAEAPVEKQWEVAYVAPFAFDDAFTVGCDKEATKLSLKWNQVEEQIIAKLGISKAEFHNEETGYKLEDAYLNDDYNVCQFSDTTVNATKLAAADKIGYVTMPENDDEADQTKILTWSIAHNDAYQIFKAGEESIQVIVRYVNETEMKYVYVTLTWTPKELNITPNGTIEDSAKINKYWYAKNGAVAGEGYSDIHANVKQVNSSNDCTFDSDILNTMTGNVINVTNDDENYPEFKDTVDAQGVSNLTKAVVFAAEQDHLTKNADGLYVVNGASGAVYSITASEDGLTLIATDVKTLESEDIIILAASENSDIKTVMQYQEESEFAKDILNNADHNLLGQDETFTAKLMFKAGRCEEVEYTLSNNVFYAKYLRPVSVDPSDVEKLVDGTNGASIADLVLNLIDWRDKHFDVEEETTGDDGTVYDFYQYYAVTTVEADIENATTDLNNGDINTQLLSKVTNKVDLRFGSDEKGANSFTITKDEETGEYSNGKFYYYNNGTTLGEFTIRVPLVVTYKWGKIYTSVDLIVNKTIQN